MPSLMILESGAIGKCLVHEGSPKKERYTDIVGMGLGGERERERERERVIDLP